MNTKWYLILFLWGVCLGCTDKKSRTMQQDVVQQTDSINKEKDVNGWSRGNEIQVYEDILDFENNLSAFVSEISFVKLANEPSIRDFFVYDIQRNDQYIFLLGPNYLRQYDLEGNFIRQIGRAGQGPGEYIQLSAPLMLDNENGLIYVCDGKLNRLFAYDFDGRFKKAVRIPEECYCVTRLDSSLIAVRTHCFHRYTPFSGKALQLMEYKGRIVKSFDSYLYPVPHKEGEHYGSEVNPLWNYQGDFYTLEYGNDTIYQVTKDALLPSTVLTGKRRMGKDDLFKKEQEDKLKIAGPVMKPNSYVFESNRFMLFRMYSSTEIYHLLYDKKTGKMTRTGNQEKSYEFEYKGDKSKDFFIDDLVSGMVVDPLYQSDEWAIGLIPAMSIVEDRSHIIQYIDAHPTEEGAKLKAIIQNMNEEDNSIICFIKLK